VRIPERWKAPRFVGSRLPSRGGGGSGPRPTRVRRVGVSSPLACADRRLGCSRDAIEEGSSPPASAFARVPSAHAATRRKPSCSVARHRHRLARWRNVEGTAVLSHGRGSAVRRVCSYVVARCRSRKAAPGSEKWISVTSNRTSDIHGRSLANGTPPRRQYCGRPWQQGASGAESAVRTRSEEQPRTGSRWQSREAGERSTQRAGRSATISWVASRSRSPADGRHPRSWAPQSLHGDCGEAV